MTTAADRLLMTARHKELSEELDAQSKQLAEILKRLPVTVPPVVTPPVQPPVVQSPVPPVPPVQPPVQPPTPSSSTITSLTADSATPRTDGALQFFGDWLCLGGEGNTPRWPTLSKDCPLPGRTHSFKCASRASSFLALYRSDTPWMYPEGVTFTAMVRYTAGLVANVADPVHKRGQAKLKLMRKNPGGGETGTTGWGIGVDIGNAWGSVAVVEDDGGDYDQSFGYGKIVPDTWQELREYIKPLNATTFEVSAWFGGVQLHNKRVMTRATPLAVTDKSVIEFGLPVVQMQARPAEENVLYLDDVVMTSGFVPPPAPLAVIATTTMDPTPSTDYPGGRVLGAFASGGGIIVKHPAFTGGFALQVDRPSGVESNVGYRVQPLPQQPWRTMEIEFEYFYMMLSGAPNNGSANKLSRLGCAWPISTDPGFAEGWFGTLLVANGRFAEADMMGMGDAVHYQTSGPTPDILCATAANPITKARRIRHFVDMWSKGRRHAEASIDGVEIFNHDIVYAPGTALNIDRPGAYVATSQIRGIQNNPADNRREWIGNVVVRGK